MKIYCTSCNMYLGEIKEAYLRKEIFYLCKYCEEKWRTAVNLAEATRRGKPYDSNPFPDIFGDIFKGKK